MADTGTFRNVNIICELTASSGSQLIDIYRPATINPNTVVAGAKYSGFITSLRMSVNIKSVSELILPDPDLLASDEAQQLKEKEVVLNTSRKSICLYVKNSLSPPVLAGEILLFNRYPYYFIDLLKYLTSSSTFDAASDTTISVQIKEVGHGLLQGDDKITIIGSAVEEAPLPETNALYDVNSVLHYS